MNKTIIIVDDEKSICQSLGAILTDEGYDVLTAESGEEALKIIKEELPSLSSSIYGFRGSMESRP